jgi:hypothetical protein
MTKSIIWEFEVTSKTFSSVNWGISKNALKLEVLIMKQKAGITMIFMAFFFSINLMALDWGFKLGLNHTGYSISNQQLSVDYRYRNSFRAGLFLSFNLSKTFSLQTELYGCSKGLNFFSDHAGLEWKNKHEIFYLEFPLLLKYKIPYKGPSRPSIFLGPYAGRKINSRVTNIFDNESEYMIDIQDDLEDCAKKWDFGIVFGGNVEYDLCFGTVVVDIRYIYGLSNINRDSLALSDKLNLTNVFRENDKIKNRVLGIMIGFVF